MNQLNKKLLLTGFVAVAILAGCGGSDNDNPTPTATPAIPPPPEPTVGTEQTVSAVLDYINNMIANLSENSDPVDVNSITLAVDDTVEPTGLK